MYKRSADRLDEEFGWLTDVQMRALLTLITVAASKGGMRRMAFDIPEVEAE